MLRLDSNKVEVQMTADALYAHLSDLRNFGPVMPEGTQSFTADDASMKFTLKGLPEIKLKPKTMVAPELISLEVAGGKIPFSLTAHISAIGEKCTVYIAFEGNINPMMSMMVKQPLQKFINSLADNMSTKLS